MEKLNILLYCNRPKDEVNAGTIIDHIDAFKKYSKHNIYIFSNTGAYPEKLNLNRFDALIIHYSSSLLNNHYISEKAKKLITKYNGLKILFIQDEYRRINFIVEQMIKLKIDIIYTCFPEEEVEKIYPSEKLPNLTRINNLTGYVPKQLLEYPTPLIKNRKIDVGYRTRKLPLWYGKLAYDKWHIVDKFCQYTKSFGLVLDLSYNENDRIYGDKWLQFISNCRCMLGTESGTEVIDYTGTLEERVNRYQLLHPKATFEDINTKFLSKHSDYARLNQISPRCFEAIALRTPLVLYEGRYSDILTANRHYIELKKDFSNLTRVIKAIKDSDALQALADCAYKEIALNPIYSYEFFINNFDKLIENEFYKRNKIKRLNPYSEVAYNVASKSHSFCQRQKKNIRDICVNIYKSLPNPLQQIASFTLKLIMR